MQTTKWTSTVCIRARHVLAGIWLAAFIISCSGCNFVAVEPQSQIEESSTHQTPSPVTEQSAKLVSPVNTWEVYDVNAVAWGPDSAFFAVAGREDRIDESFGVYNFGLSSTKIFWRSDLYVPFSLTYHPDNEVIAVPSLGLKILDKNTGEVVDAISSEKGCVGTQEIAYSQDGSSVFTLGTNSDLGLTSIFQLNTKTHECFGIIIQENGVAFDFELSQNSKILAIALRDIKVGSRYEQQVHVWDVETRKQVCGFMGSGPVALTLDGNILAARRIDRPGEVDLWDTKACHLLNTLQIQEQNGPLSMDFSPDGQILAVGGKDIFQLWEVASRKLLFESAKLPNLVSILAFSPDGRFLLSVTDKTSVDDKAIITLWEVKQ